jgi:cytochrome c-type biogenesis protein CcmH/NrfG
MRRRHRSRGKRRRQGAKAGSAPPRGSSPAALGERTADDIAISRVGEEDAPVDLDRLAPAAALREAGLREPPSLIVEGPEGARRRRARDERDGVEVADPRRGMLYVGIAVFVALVVFAVLGLIESR